MISEKDMLKALALKINSTLRQESHDGFVIFDQVSNIIRECGSLPQLRIVLADIGEMASELDGSLLNSLDDSLRSENLPTLTCIRKNNVLIFCKILDVGEINSEEEYRLTVSYLNDTESGLPEGSAQKAGELVAKYDQCVRRDI